jgi:hypothetical protein
MKYGFAEAEWDRGRDEMTRILGQRAAERGMITYSDLSSQLTTIHLEPHDPALWHMPGEISQAESEAGRGMLSVVVVHKYSDMEPGSGFFELAESLGRDVADRSGFWVAELHLVHGCWSRP